MGEARRKRLSPLATIYHHTSTLRTNLIWMSGVIDVEGKSEGVWHPQLGTIKTNALARRGLTDFPAVAWFTSQISIPKCLISSSLWFENKDEGTLTQIEVDVQIAHGMTLNRVALGFPLAEINVTPWRSYRGYSTPEGMELSQSAREVGDNPDDWYVSETPIDVLKISEFWSSRSVNNPKLERSNSYINDIRRMVTMCRERTGVYIPPTWMRPEQAKALASRLGVGILDPRA